jgi:hypothetical protein
MAAGIGSKGRTVRRRALGWAIVLTALCSMVAVPFTASASAPKANALSAFSGMATGSVLHADAIEAAGTRLVNVDEAFSGATVNTRGLSSAVTTEMKTLVQPKMSSKKSYARGSGVEVGLAVPAAAANQIKLAGLAEAAAAPAQKIADKQLGPLKLNPLAYASLLRGRAGAQWPAADACPIGQDISRGDGYAADLQLLNGGGVSAAGQLLKPLIALDATKPARTVAHSTSRTLLVRQTDSKGNIIGKNFALMSEVRMTIAPVTLLRGTSSEFTIEFLGEWVMQVVAGGVKGGSWVHYGPGTVSPQTPVLRVLSGPLGTVNTLLTTQQLLGKTGLVLPIGNIEIAIGEDPRAIGGSANSKPTTSSDGTHSAAAIDVVRVKIPGITNVRVGHMEAASTVPAGGIVCHLPTTKVANAQSVNVGKGFSTTITVFNPFGCDLQHVRVVDQITTKQGARFQVAGTAPAASSFSHGAGLSKGTITWNDIGSIPAGGTKKIVASFVTSGSAGTIVDIADATAVIGSCAGQGGNVTGVAKSATGATISGGSPIVPVNVAKVLSGRLPGTGVADAMLMLVGSLLLGAAWTMRRTLKRFA